MLILPAPLNPAPGARSAILLQKFRVSNYHSNARLAFTALNNNPFGFIIFMSGSKKKAVILILPNHLLHLLGNIKPIGIIT